VSAALALFVSVPDAMKIDRAGYPFIAGALVPAALAAVARRPLIASSFAALGAFMTYSSATPTATSRRRPVSSSPRPTAA
jgi:hypothetical protein